MTNVNVTAEQLSECGLSSKSGLKIGWIDSAAKAAQNDTWTVLNASTVLFVEASLDATGVQDSPTISGNIVTLTGSGTGASSGIILYR